MNVHEILPVADEALAHQLLLIQHVAYALEAELIGDRRIPPLHEDVDGLRSAPLSWLGAYSGSTLIGALAWSEDAEEVDIDRLVVSPDAHRRGVGTALVRCLLQRAGQRRTVVATGRDNTPARTLYERLDFDRVDDVEVLPGLWITRYAHVR